MEAWSGGLPPVAAARVERQRASGTAGSLLSAPAAAAVRAAGLAPAGEVFGCLVMNLGWSAGFCGAYASGLGTSSWGTGAWQTTPVVTTGESRGSRNGFGPYARAVEQAWGGALHRMLSEARALGADGVVGVRTTRSRISGRAEEFTALGTAVRVLGSRASSPLVGDDVWSAGLSGEDCASAILSGSVPRGLALGLSVATKHADYAIAQQRSSWSNTEVTGLSELLHAARSDARQRLAASARQWGGGDLVITGMGLHQFETPCTGEQEDLHAEAIFTGTVLTRASTSPRASSSMPTGAGRRRDVLPVLPLTSVTSRTDPRSRS